MMLWETSGGYIKQGHTIYRKSWQHVNKTKVDGGLGFRD